MSSNFEWEENKGWENKSRHNKDPPWNNSSLMGRGSNKHEHRCLADPQKGIGENKEGAGQHLIKPDRMSRKQMLWISYNNHQPAMWPAGSSSSERRLNSRWPSSRHCRDCNNGFLPDWHHSPDSFSARLCRVWASDGVATWSWWPIILQDLRNHDPPPVQIGIKDMKLLPINTHLFIILHLIDPPLPSIKAQSAWGVMSQVKISREREG